MSDSEDVRLPELAIFRKYSLALRQEFADPAEVLKLLERSVSEARRNAKIEPPDLIGEETKLVEANFDVPVKDLLRDLDPEGPRDVPAPQRAGIRAEPDGNFWGEKSTGGKRKTGRRQVKKADKVAGRSRGKVIRVGKDGTPEETPLLKQFDELGD